VAGQARVALPKRRQGCPSPLDEHLAQVLAAALGDPDDRPGGGDRRRRHLRTRTRFGGLARPRATSGDDWCGMVVSRRAHSSVRACSANSASRAAMRRSRNSQRSVGGRGGHGSHAPHADPRGGRARALGVPRSAHRRPRPGELGPPLRHDVAALQQDGAELVHQRRALAEALVTHPVSGTHHPADVARVRQALRQGSEERRSRCRGDR
jgi:hypothetical protein